MGILRFVEEEAIDCFFDAEAAPAMESFIVTPPGTAAANRPPPVAARNCLRSTDLLTRELRTPNPQKWPSRPAKLRPAALYASWGERKSQNRFGRDE